MQGNEMKLQYLPWYIWGEGADSIPPFGSQPMVTPFWPLTWPKELNKTQSEPKLSTGLEFLPKLFIGSCDYCRIHTSDVERRTPKPGWCKPIMLNWFTWKGLVGLGHIKTPRDHWVRNTVMMAHASSRQAESGIWSCSGCWVHDLKFQWNQYDYYKCI